MQRSQLLYDGLWRCLCPSFDRPALCRAAVGGSVALRRSAKLRQPGGATASSRFLQVRRYETSAPEVTEDLLRPPQEHGTSETPRQRSWQERLLAPTPPTDETLKACTVDEIFEALVALRDVNRWKPTSQDVDQHDRIVQLITHLLRSEGQPISPFMYECMVDAMADPQGSVEGVRRLLDDMAGQGMKPTAAFCNGALQALMNHPDYMMRQEILGIMQEYWFTIDTPARQNLIIGYLRDEQYELAYARLIELIEQGARIDDWVYDIFILAFGKLGFFDEMLQLLYRRKNLQDPDAVVTSLIYYALDVCSQAYHHAGTVFGWVSVVRNSLMQPADGIIENVLGTAARHADAQLATEALDLISTRTRAQTHHYEAVVEAFAGSGDMAAAFRTLSIMRENGIRISGGHTRAIYGALKNRPELLGEAEAAVRALAAEHSLPQAIIGVVIEAMAELQGSEKAMGLYRDVPKLCHDELPGARMMQDLIVNSAEEATVQVLAKEYSSRFLSGERMPPTIKRSSGTYDALIAKCAEAGEMDLAFEFAKKSMAGGINKGRSGKWVKILVEQAIAKEDGRIWAVVDRLSNSGDEETSKIVQRILQQKRIAKLTAAWKSSSTSTAAAAAAAGGGGGQR